MYPAIFHLLQPKVGFAWTTRIIAFIALGTLLICIAVMKRRVTPPSRRRLIDLGAWKELPFNLFALGGFLGFMGLYVPFFFINSFAIGKTAASRELAFYFVSILNASSTVGRILPSFFADRVGPLNVLIPCTFITGILAFSWIAVHDVSGLVIFAVFYGFFSGTFVSLPPSAIATLSPDLKSVGTRMGMAFCVAGFGLLTGTPIGGALLDLKDMNFLRAQIFCGVTVVVGAVALLSARIAKVGTSLTTKL